MALKRINKELTDLGRCVVDLTRPSPVIARRYRIDLGRYADTSHSDPPSSCSAGPIGDDLVRDHAPQSHPWT